MSILAPILGIERLAFPLVRLLIRSDITWPLLAEELKRVYVQVAEKEMSLTARDSSKSRVAMLTGLSRREVARLLEEAATELRPAGLDREVSACAKTVSVWRSDSRFLNEDGYPKALSSTAEFVDLVRAINRDLPPRVIERELLSTNTVRRDEGGILHLNARAFVGMADDQAAWELLGTDMALLLETISHNLATDQSQDRRFQRRVFFRNLSAAGVERLKRIAEQQGQELLEAVDRELASEDMPIKDPSRIEMGRPEKGRLGAGQIESDRSEGSHSARRTASATGKFAGLSIHFFERSSPRTQDPA